MSSSQLVATLVAPADAVLCESQVEPFIKRIMQSGGIVEKTVWLDKGRAADVFFTGGQATEDSSSFDILVQPVATRRKKILIADMESTIIEQEMLDEVAALIGIGEKVATITRRAMNGELDFAAALIERVGLLKGQPASLLDEVAARMTLSPGAEALVAAMRRAGGKAWLVSGGFTFFVKKIAEQVGFDKYFCNDLRIEGGVITGEVLLPILDKDTKKDLLEKACASYGCVLSESLAVGDGSNDVPMLQACNAGGGLGVAYRAKPRVRELVSNQINHSDLSALIYAQNIH
jgi:phosphoserine phosphatase